MGQACMSGWRRVWGARNAATARGGGIAMPKVGSCVLLHLNQPKPKASGAILVTDGPVELSAFAGGLRASA